MAEKIELLPGEEIIFRSRPAVKSLWVFIAGIILMLGGPLVKPEAPIGLGTGIFVSFIFLIIILRRYTEVYTITNQRILTRGGLIERTTYKYLLKDIAKVEANQGYNLRWVGAGHILITSKLPDEGSIILLGQDKPFELKEKIDELIREAVKD